MVIKIPNHKSFLFSLFIENGQEKRFPLAKLEVAASLNKKLIEDAESTYDEKTDQTLFKWKDTEISLTLDESTLAKELFKSVTEATTSQHTIIKELTELFEQ